MTCDEYRAGALADPGALHADHLATCPSCRSDAESLSTAADLLNDPLLWEEPAPSLEAQVVGALTSHQAPNAHSLERRHRATRTAVAFAVAAALVVAVSATAIGFAVFGESGPDWEITISGGSQAPEAGGTVRGWASEAGTRVAFDVTDIDPAPDGFVYELWFSAADVHMSGGTFRTFEDVELWVGVSRREFPRVWVTLEAVDADSTPSRSVVLDTRS